MPSLLDAPVRETAPTSREERDADFRLERPFNPAHIAAEFREDYAGAMSLWQTLDLGWRLAGRVGGAVLRVLNALNGTQSDPYRRHAARVPLPDDYLYYLDRYPLS